jgi:hypothetical protein
LYDRDTIWTILNDNCDFTTVDYSGQEDILSSRYKFTTPLELTEVCSVVDNAITTLPAHQCGSVYIGLCLPRIIDVQIQYPPPFSMQNLLSYARYKIGIGETYVSNPEFKHGCVIGLLQSKLEFTEVGLHKFETNLSQSQVCQIIYDFVV